MWRPSLRRATSPAVSRSFIRWETGESGSAKVAAISLPHASPSARSSSVRRRRSSARALKSETAPRNASSGRLDCGRAA